MLDGDREALKQRARDFYMGVLTGESAEQISEEEEMRVEEAEMMAFVGHVTGNRPVESYSPEDAPELLALLDIWREATVEIQAQVRGGGER